MWTDFSRVSRSANPIWRGAKRYNIENVSKQSNFYFVRCKPFEAALSRRTTVANLSSPVSQLQRIPPNVRPFPPFPVKKCQIHMRFHDRRPITITIFVFSVHDRFWLTRYRQPNGFQWLLIVFRIRGPWTRSVEWTSLPAQWRRRPATSHRLIRNCTNDIELHRLRRRWYPSTAYP